MKPGNKTELAIYTTSVIAFLLALLFYSNYYYFNQGLNSLLQSSSSLIAQLNETREHYSRHNIDKIIKANPQLLTGHDHKLHSHKVPNPATFTIELCNELTAKKLTQGCSVFSEHPFPWRYNAQKLNAKFEKNASQAFQQGKASYYETKLDQDKQRVHYAEPILMEQSCVDCHNSHKDSPKRDWKVGDIRGGIHVIMPLTITKNYTLLIATAVLTLILLGLLFYNYVIRNLAYSENQKKNALYKKAHLDELTEILNRDSFIEKYNYIYYSSTNIKDSISLLFITIKGLSHIQYNIGVDDANHCIKHTASSLINMKIKNIEAISRYSDNTIVLLLRNTDETTTKELLKNISANLNSNKHQESYHINAIGSCFSPGTIMNCQLIINRLALLASQNKDSSRYFSINDL